MNFAINGFGRIGRAIFRLAFCGSNRCLFINEPNANNKSICYFLKYDSLYGTFAADVIDNGDGTIAVRADEKYLRIVIYHYKDVAEFASRVPDDCIIIEANGNSDHIDYYKNHVNKKSVFTFSSRMIVDEVIFGVNDIDFLRHGCNSNVISGSICDTVAIAPVLKSVYSCAPIKETLITTMHPALSYQKVIDNYVEPTQNLSLGRQYIDSIIPKRTSAEEVLKRHFKHNIRCLSFRVPTESVCCADITFLSESRIDSQRVLDSLNLCKYIDFSYDDLVSIDYKASHSSAVVDMRWFEMVSQNILKIVIWYDNEYGYSSRILDLMEYYYGQNNKENMPNNRNL